MQEVADRIKEARENNVSSSSQLQEVSKGKVNKFTDEQAALLNRMPGQNVFLVSVCVDKLISHQSLIFSAVTNTLMLRTLLRNVRTAK